MGEERRATPRVRAYRPVRLQQTGIPRVVETLTKDLGMGGMRCVSPVLLPVSAEVSVELMLSTGAEPLTTRGRAVWFHTIPQSEQFDLGISFFDLPPTDKRRLSAYLERLSSISQFALVI